MNDSNKTLWVLTTVLAAGTLAPVGAQDTGNQETGNTAKVATESPGVQGEKIEDVKSINNGTSAIATKVNKGTVTGAVAKSVPGIKGAPGGKMGNLEKALGLSGKGGGAPGGGSPGGGPPGGEGVGEDPSDTGKDGATPGALAKLLDKKKGKSPPETLDNEVKDGRDLPQKPPPNEAGGS